MAPAIMVRTVLTKITMAIVSALLMLAQKHHGTSLPMVYHSLKLGTAYHKLSDARPVRGTTNVPSMYVYIV